MGKVMQSGDPVPVETEEHLICSLDLVLPRNPTWSWSMLRAKDFGALET